MPRFKLTIEYDGAPFAGWQRQDNAPSVQAALEGAAAALAGHECLVYGAGRTDAGVHALAQAAHVDIAKDVAPDTVRDALNHHLGEAPIAVLSAERAADDFHARFDAASRVYLYRLIDRRARLTLDRARAWRAPQPLDAAAMHQAAQALVGRHDFTTFRDSQCQADSPVKTLDRIEVRRAAGRAGEPGAEVEVWCEARSFLHRQVRSI
ncbi:MAG: tRNA pseudouridine(38-40) synthase TruA, partial [Caulobacterales bacterium]|nr:tRNA pseudouridine(38-40) synthase TruA [Caulobacterales bacterium]